MGGHFFLCKSSVFQRGGTEGAETKLLSSKLPLPQTNRVALGSCLTSLRLSFPRGTMSTFLLGVLSEVNGFTYIKHLEEPGTQ